MSQKLVKYRGEWISKKREAKLEQLGRGFLVFREDNLAQIINPTCLRSNIKCAITKKTIFKGDYAYKCYSNPVRLSPYGNERVGIGSVLNRFNNYLPKGSYATRIPTTEAMYTKSEIARADKAKRSLITKEANRLLKSNK